jgi:exosortase
MSPEYRKKKHNIKAIILAGNGDFGRCPLASRLPAALWPIAGKPALEHLIQHLWRQGIKQTVICSNGNARQLNESITGSCSMELKFLDEPLPVGTAGCLRDAADDWTDTLLALPAGIVSPPNIDMLIHTHRANKSDMTVVFQHGSKEDTSSWHTAEIYICERGVLDYIPKEGYCDIKEGLIPVMVRAGKTVHAATLSKTSGKFRDRAQYLRAIAQYLDNAGNESIDLPQIRRNGVKKLWLAETATVNPSAQAYGPVVIMDNASISEEAVIFGPAIIGRNVSIGRNTLIQNSVFWDGSTVGQNCRIHNCVVDHDAVVLDNSTVENEAVICGQNNKFNSLTNKVVAEVNDKTNQLYCACQSKIERINAKLVDWVQAEKLRACILRLIPISILTGVFLWSYWPVLVDLWGIWQRSDEYSSGMLVPFLALYVLWGRRHKIAAISLRPSIWGIGLFAVAQMMRYFGLFFMYSSAERLSLVASIASLTLLLFGWQLFRKVLPILFFLCLMLPLPRSIHTAIMLPLQNLATSSAVFFLEMTGYTVIQQGNVINLNGVTIAVAEACNGLRMVTSFFVIVGLVVLLIQRSWWEKLIVLCSGLPIALLCNAVRLTITAIVFTKLSGEKLEIIFHDFGGYAMMPLALVIVIFELWFLAKLTMAPKEVNRQVIVRKTNN